MNISSGQYVAVKSVIHALDPRAKLLSVLLLVTSLLMIKTFKMMFLALIILFMIIKLTKIPLKSFIKSISGILYVIIFTFVMNFIILVFKNGFNEAIRDSLFVSLRLLLLMLYALMLPLTTSPLELSDAVSMILKPLERYKFPVNDVSMMFGISLRFLPLLMLEADKITKSQISRGARINEGNIFNRVKSFFPVLVPLFVIIFRRADEVAAAMEVRGYDSSKSRTRMKPMKWKLQDNAAIILSAAAAIIFRL